MKIIEIENWKRAEHFKFFSKFDEPFFGINSEIDCTAGYEFSKKKGLSFFAYYLFKSLVAVNKIEEFRYRIVNQNVVIYDKIHSSSTIGRTDGSFAFSFVEYDPSFEIFNESLQREIKNVKNSTGLRFNDEAKRLDSIHYSSLPWIKFTGVTHARDFKFPDSIPKITFGKVDKSKKMMMPISVVAHHGLMDAYHVGQYLELFESLLNDNKI